MLMQLLLKAFSMADVDCLFPCGETVVSLLQAIDATLCETIDTSSLHDKLPLNNGCVSASDQTMLVARVFLVGGQVQKAASWRRQHQLMGAAFEGSRVGLGCYHLWCNAL